MLKNYVHVHIILDRSGSMSSVKKDIIEMFNSFLQKQVKLPGKTTLSLVQFDDEDPYEILVDMQEVQLVPLLTNEQYQPRGMTPLLDAIGKGMNDLQEKIRKMKKSRQPESVLFAVFTDGFENHSKEFSFKDISTRMKELEKKYGWQFYFFGTELKGIEEAAHIGFSHVTHFKKNRAGISTSMKILHEQVYYKKSMD